ncbi:DUF4129 domain-containing protein [Mesobacillus maritimus]|uniref:DUF4129 domain-containing protein n=1 Tax=Mesobacillus maritimus TaxID=1643336 RepID=A0ABS7K829_9BACI|nr:DUF4129 domain-containing protein [Mesobacillus maritimus]MBY0098426.1 hypothetical protein [Mesobacillus maritimus]
MKNYFVYLPILAILFWLMVVGYHYPVLVVILWLAFMTWRNFRFDRHGPESHPLAILLSTTFLLLIGVMFFNHVNLIWYGVTQIGLVVGGTWLKLFAESINIKSTQSSLWLISIFVLVLIAGSGVAYSVYPLLSATIGVILSAVGFVFRKVVLGIVGVIGWFGIDLTFLEGIVDEKTYQQVTGNMGGTINRALDMAADTPSNQEGFNFLNDWTISLFVVLIVVIAYFLFKKKYVRENQVVNLRTIASVEASPPSEEKERKINHTKQLTPDNPIRRKVLEFEQEALKRGYGRKSTETIEEWFARLHLKADYLDFYQKIRYGEQELNERQEQQAQRLLEELRNMGKRTVS